jgi:D-beta-D-heptose 7-phosphate kinase/D-beta-D-heptose 1-phosphate adenosyltransferase
VLLLDRRDLPRAAGEGVREEDAVAAGAATLRRAHGFGAVLVARGDAGMTLADAAGTRHLPGEAGEAFDPSGARDSAVAVLGAALATGTPLPLAARLANLAAGITMTRAGTAVVRMADLLAALLGAQRGPQAGDASRVFQRGEP